MSSTRVAAVRRLNILARLRGEPSKVAIAKPAVTGNGPFAALPEFEPIGYPSNLLNISLPSSSKLNIRTGSMVAINGDLSKLSSGTRWLTGTTDYQEVRTNAAVSLVVNGNGHQYSIINIKDAAEQWSILRDDALVAWTGFSLQLRAADLVPRENSFQTRGKGVIVVNSPGHLYEVALESGEEMAVHPASLVATSGVPGRHAVSGSGAASAVWHAITTAARPLGRVVSLWPQRWSPSPYYRDLRERVVSASGVRDTPLPAVWARAQRYAASSAAALFARPAYLTVRGPARVLLNSHTGNRAA